MIESHMADQNILKDSSNTTKEVEFKEVSPQDEEKNKKTDVLQDTDSPGGEKSKNRKKSEVGSPRNKGSKFSEEELFKISQAFALSDIATGRTGAISAKEVVNVVRTLGQCPTQIEVQELILEVDITRRRRTGATGRGGSTKKKGRKQKKDPNSCNGDGEVRDSNTCDFPEVMKILEKKGKKPETEKDILDAFRAFDVKGNGVISSKKMKKILTTMGEKLTDEEFDFMIREAECYNGDGKVKYEKFVRVMMEE